MMVHWWKPLALSAIRGVCYGTVIFTVMDSVGGLLYFIGPSMEPTVHENEIGLCEKVTSYQNFQRGDIVIALQPDEPTTQICKRIMGLEGEQINNSKNPINNTSGGKYFGGIVPRGHVWLEGDNKSSSRDSRHFGPVPLALVHGRVFAKIYPFPEMTWFRRSPKPTT
uniref:Mitochondrial inner membrane protease subunit 1-like n=1 Tax=Phallusia mammillata TaxID=59560 RepID=A0A6F9DFS8_9ASCI|nr:mitochondrial inner membrane protease subunit 1-like [Phallusia mammillata]